MSHNILQHAVRSLTAKLKEWPWQKVTCASGCSANKLVATPYFFPIILLHFCSLQCWRLRLNLSKKLFIASQLLRSLYFLTHKSQENLTLPLNYHLLYQCKRKTVPYSIMIFHNSFSMSWWVYLFTSLPFKWAIMGFHLSSRAASLAA